MAFDELKFAQPETAQPGCTFKKYQDFPPLPPEVFPSAHSSMRGDQFLSMFILLAKRYFVLPPVTDPVHKPKKMSADANILALASAKECGESLIYGTADRRTKTGNLQNLRMINLEK